jgi:hypothetical protein
MGTQTPGLVVRVVESGVVAPLVARPAEWKRLVGDPRSAHSIRSDCETGRLPTLPALVAPARIIALRWLRPWTSWASRARSCQARSE